MPAPQVVLNALTQRHGLVHCPEWERLQDVTQVLDRCAELVPASIVAITLCAAPGRIHTCSCLCYLQFWARWSTLIIEGAIEIGDHACRCVVPGLIAQSALHVFPYLPTPPLNCLNQRHRLLVLGQLVEAFGERVPVSRRVGVTYQITPFKAQLPGDRVLLEFKQATELTH